MADRADRIAGVARALALPAGAAPPPVPLTPEEQRTLERAAELVKFDLASQTVIELTSLAGVMAAEYAVRSRGARAGGAGPVRHRVAPLGGRNAAQTRPGAVLALADRLDLLAGLFAVGASPTGSSDPFGLRRAALGVTAILRAWPALEPVTLTAGLDAAAAQLRGQGAPAAEAAMAQARDFIVRRLEQQFLDSGADHRHVAAVLSLADAPAVADRTLAELAKLADRPSSRAWPRPCSGCAASSRPAPRRPTSPSSSPSRPRWPCTGRSPGSEPPWAPPGPLGPPPAPRRRRSRPGRVRREGQAADRADQRVL